MTVKSKAQNRLMRAAARDPKVAKKTGVPQKVAKEMVDATHGKKVGKMPEKMPKRGSRTATHKGKK
ncbi:hypothetical protein ACFSHT_22495 [Paraburkholderia silviterrae]|uniref:Uncharacterized protein n=1 Tax=Paraburkholderia silviterrae TaxID=2528715 RepID=A0A4R5MF24_9BURK|nr:hypothetical protein [Paraburkholderia silviterrae]TDG25849.1 hypothetical protein EYW47_00315 [Paraburkholderia silviterrae]